MKRSASLVLALLVLAFLPACATDPTLVVASRNFYLAVSPEYALYVEADPTLTREQKDRRYETIRLFDETLRVREEAVK